MRSEDRDVISWNCEHLLLDLPQPRAPASVVSRRRFCPPVRMFGPQGQIGTGAITLTAGGLHDEAPRPSGELAAPAAHRRQAYDRRR
jgi:hypothetical protein